MLRKHRETEDTEIQSHRPRGYEPRCFFGKFVTAFGRWLILDHPFAYYHNGPLTITLERPKVALVGPVLSRTTPVRRDLFHN